jgi:hypothetical protein
LVDNALLLNRSHNGSRLRLNGSRNRWLGRVVNEEVDLVAVGTAGQINSICHILVRCDRDGITLIVHVAESVSSVAQSALLNSGLATNGLQFLSKLRCDLRNKSGNTIGGKHIDTVDTAAGGLELEGEGSSVVRWVVLRDDFRVLIAVMRGGIIRKKTVVVA